MFFVGSLLFPPNGSAAVAYSFKKNIASDSVVLFFFSSTFLFFRVHQLDMLSSAINYILNQLMNSDAEFRIVFICTISMIFQSPCCRAVMFSVYVFYSYYDGSYTKNHFAQLNCKRNFSVVLFLDLKLFAQSKNLDSPSNTQHFIVTVFDL